jgi:hypothetical protein
MSCLGGEVPDEAMLLDGYDAHLQLLENRTKTTADTYRSHVKGFLRYFAKAEPSVALMDVTKLQVRAWLFHEANRGIAPVTRANKLFALRSFYRFLIAEGLSEENPASLVTLPSPNRPRVEFYGDAEADAIIEWASAQPGLRWQVARAMLLTFRYTGLRLDACAPRRSILTPGVSRSSARDASREWSPSPTFWRTYSGRTWMNCGPSSRRPRTCSPTPGATEVFADATGRGQCTISCARPGHRREWAVGTFPTGGVTPTLRASFAGAWTSTSCSA